MKILMFFVNFQLNQIQNWAIPEKIQTEGVENILFSTPPPPWNFIFFYFTPGSSKQNKAQPCLDFFWNSQLFYPDQENERQNI